MRWQDSGHQQPAPLAVDIAPDLLQLRVFGLLITETHRWLRDWAEWRVRFAYDNERPGMTHGEVADFVRNTATALCNWTAEGVDVVLYVHEFADLETVFRRYGAVTEGRGRIAALQKRAVYLEAARLAMELAPLAGAPKTSTEQEAEALPDMVWNVVGHDQARVATTMASGHRILVRHAYVGIHEMWLVDVDGFPDCAQWRARADEMSKLSVSIAIRMSESRRRSGRR